MKTQSHRALYSILVCLLVWAMNFLCSCSGSSGVASDGCLNVICQHGGTCYDNGICNCQTGFEGNRCEILSKDKIIGTYAGITIAATTPSMKDTVLDTFVVTAYADSLTWLNIHTDMNPSSGKDYHVNMKSSNGFMGEEYFSSTLITGTYDVPSQKLTVNISFGSSSLTTYGFIGHKLP